MGMESGIDDYDIFSRMMRKLHPIQVIPSALRPAINLMDDAFVTMNDSYESNRIYTMGWLETQK